MANQQSSNNNHTHINTGVRLDVHKQTKVELASIIKKNNKYTSNTNLSSTTTTPLASPTTNPPTSTIIHRMAHYTAIADTAATGNYITPDCPVLERQPSNQGVDVLLPDGSLITSSHTATLQLPAVLPIGARTAHVFPDLKSGSLISIGQLCDHGCIATFDATHVKIIYHDNVIMTGYRSFATNNLWILELADETTNTPSLTQAMHHQMSNSSQLLARPTVS
jgi:hypothetical protein